MRLYKRLRDNNMVINKKEYTELVYTRQIKINGEYLDDPKLKICENKKYKAVVGILQKEI